MKAQKMPAFYSIAIVGGGPAGLSLAAGLAPILAARKQNILLIEKNPIQPQLTAAFDGRTIALAHQGVDLFKKTGVWKALQKNAEPITHIRVADQFSTLKLDFHAAELNLGPFGEMVENRHLRAALWHTVSACSNVDVCEGHAVAALDVSGNLATLQLENGQTYNAALVIGADGRTSPSRQQLGIKGFGLSYNQHALICTITHNKPHNGTALEHFLPEGPFATLPLTPDKGRNRSGIVWTAKPETVQALLQLDEADFIDALNRAGASFLEPIALVTPRAHYPLSLQHAHEYTAPHFVLVGDAAHAMHPIAGQGFNMGLRDVACLIDLITEAATLGLRADDAFVLTQYEQQRRADNNAMLLATDVLDRLFSNHSRTLAAARQVGISMVDAIPPLRRFFMRQAMGFKQAA